MLVETGLFCPLLEAEKDSIIHLGKVFYRQLHLSIVLQKSTSFTHQDMFFHEISCSYVQNFRCINKQIRNFHVLMPFIFSFSTSVVATYSVITERALLMCINFITMVSLFLKRKFPHNIMFRAKTLLYLHPLWTVICAEGCIKKSNMICLCERKKKYL